MLCTECESIIVVVCWLDNSTDYLWLLVNCPWYFVMKMVGLRLLLLGSLIALYTCCLIQLTLSQITPEDEGPIIIFCSRSWLYVIINSPTLYVKKGSGILSRIFDPAPFQYSQCPESCSSPAQRSREKTEKLGKRRSLHNQLDRSYLQFWSEWRLSTCSRIVGTVTCHHNLLFIQLALLPFFSQVLLVWSRRLLRRNLSGALSPELGRLTHVTILYVNVFHQ